MKQFQKTMALTLTLSLTSIITATLIQLRGQNKVTEKCSYLDPIIIDILATSAALFLIIEGFFDLYKNKELSLKSVFTKIIRIVFGFAILTLHTIQFLHK
jgi:hypothetical protein